MQSQIDPNKPTSDNPTVASVRENFAHAKSEIESAHDKAYTLQTTTAGHATNLANLNQALQDALNRITALENASAPPPPPPPPPVLEISHDNNQPFDLGDVIMFAVTITNTGAGTLYGAYVDLDASNANGPLEVMYAPAPQTLEHTDALDQNQQATVSFPVTIADPKAFNFTATARGRITDIADQSSITSNTLTGTLTGEI